MRCRPAAGSSAWSRRPATTRPARSRPGRCSKVHNPDTIADGARTPCLGEITFPLVLRYVHDMVTVSDRELLAAMLYLWERMKIVIEPTGALGAAGLFERKVSLPPGSRVGVIISGGNVDVRDVCRWISERPRATARASAR